MRTHYSFLHRGALSLNQGGVDKADSLSSEIFDASSRLQTMKTSDAIENRLQVMQQWQGRIFGMPAITADGEQKTAFESIWKAYQFEEQSRAELEGHFGHRRG